MKKKAIVTIHGIHTGDLSTWQDNFRFFLKSQNRDVKIFQYEYGKVLGIYAWFLSFGEKLMVPKWLRKRTVNQFADYVRKLQNKFPDYDFSILAHSFGTWISYHALKNNPEINIRNLVLVGGVISQHQERSQLIDWLENERLGAVYAYWSHSDSVVGKIAIEPFGKLGFYGFIRHDHNEDYLTPQIQPYPDYRIFNREHEGHGGALRFLDKYGKQLISDLLEE